MTRLRATPTAAVPFGAVRQFPDPGSGGCLRPRGASIFLPWFGIRTYGLWGLFSFRPHLHSMTMFCPLLMGT
jgi:hypothetical protein